MTSVSVVDRAGRTWLTVSWSRAIVWASILLPVVVALGALQLAAPEQPWWPGVFVLVLALAAGVVPDSSAGMMTIIGFIAWWVYAVPAEAAVGWPVLLAALALLAFHQSVALAAAGPPGVGIAGVVRLRMLGRSLAVIGVTAGLVLFAGVAEGRFASPAVLVALAVLAVGVLPVVASRRW